MRRLAELAAAGASLMLLALPITARGQAADGELRVCADPNNMPFSNSAREGFENKLTDMIAHKLGKRVSYTWWAQRRGFVRQTLKSGSCDVVIGVPAHYGLLETTVPYYRSTYVFVTQQSRHLGLTSITDPRLRDLTIGVHLIGDDGNNPPPAHALGQQGIVENVRGYPIYGDYRDPNPPSRLIDAVTNGEIDVAAAWGPLGGYFAQRSKVPLAVTPIADSDEFAPQRFQFDIAMGVRKGDHQLRDELNAFIAENRGEITTLLKSYGVPLIEPRLSASGG